MHAPVEGSPTDMQLPVGSRVFGRSEWLREALYIRRLSGNGFFPWLWLFLAEGSFTREGAESVATSAPQQQYTLEQFSSVVETRVTSPVRRCGSKESRRHLECRSFKPERRTTSLRSIVPRLGFVSSVGCLKGFTGGVDSGYFAYGAGGRGFESRRSSLPK
jgi:hypothetical protein